MKTRIITGIVMGLVIVPTILIGKIPFLIFGCLISIIAGYEMMHMFYTKTPSLKILQYLVPFFSGGITLLIYFINVHGLSYLWLILTLLTLIIFSMCVVIFIKDSTAENMLHILMTIAYCGLLIGYVISIRYLSLVKL